MFEFVLNDNEEVKPAFAHRIGIFRIECHHEVLTGSPCETFPRPRPEEGPEPSGEITCRPCRRSTARSVAETGM